MTHRHIEVPETLFFELWADYLERVGLGTSQSLIGFVWARFGSCTTAVSFPVRLVELGEDRGTVVVCARGDVFDPVTWVVSLCDLFDVCWDGES